MKDAAFNGLQFEGCAEIFKVGLAVDACLKTYQNAVDAGCQMVICHHGFIWEDVKKIDGALKRQIQFLVEHDLNIFASHLPLDAHAELGNNILLAKAADLQSLTPFGNYHAETIGFSGRLSKKLSIDALAKKLRAFCGGSPTVMPFGKKEIETVSIVSGGGSSAIAEAIEKEFDCFVTGEGPHYTHHLALEAKLNVIYLGHYHSEKCGVQAVGREIAKKFSLDTLFLDEPTLLG